MDKMSKFLLGAIAVGLFLNAYSQFRPHEAMAQATTEAQFQQNVQTFLSALKNNAENSSGYYKVIADNLIHLTSGTCANKKLC